MNCVIKQLHMFLYWEWGLSLPAQPSLLMACHLFYKWNNLQCGEKSILQIFPVKTLIYIKEHISETHWKLKILNFPMKVGKYDKAFITGNMCVCI